MGLGPIGNQFVPVLEEELQDGVLNEQVTEVVDEGMELDNNGI